MPDIHSHDDLPDLAYPYALDALSDEDQRAVEHLLEHADEGTAVAFRATVRDIRETLASMTLVDALPAPPDLEANIQRALDEQLGTSSFAAARARRIPGLRWLAVAAAAVVVIGVGAAVAVNRIQPDDSGAITAQQVIDHSDTRATTGLVTGGGTVTVNTSRDLNSAAVSFQGVSALPEGRTFQMWLLPEVGDPRSAGVLGSLPTDRDPLVMSLSDARAVALSIEPAGGSPQPTTTPIVAVPFS
ncbi:anti-sigma factor [Nocardia jejuensis]|uniref:anti-sigma factor n=1 Tax=Nocardia jejuensis TaxID=328049 RepID=UPI000835A773|nr:anti-sigma factor [Nocardia jejuensis]